MTINTEQPPERKIFAEGKGMYSIADGNKYYIFLFPIQNTLVQNYDLISYLKDELFKAIEDQAKKEKEQQTKPNHAE